jgi:demethylmenaquinone methyltransferase/2-methoxy-6-polyprenyl-1,4-benzoquinol methylase
MFAAIAPSYDLNNRLHSLWMDQHWRRVAVRLADIKVSDVIVDVACGTGDLTLRFAERLVEICNADAGSYPLVPPRDQLFGIDFTYEMLPFARRKSRERPVKGTGGRFNLAQIIQWLCGDAMSLPIPDRSADVASIAFGIRNVADPAAAVREFRRILRPGGRLVILEFSLPANPLLRGIYNFYFRKILPRTATFISGDSTGAYKYLPESVNTFIGREQMVAMMRDAGFQEVKQINMTFGVCIAYVGYV